MRIYEASDVSYLFDQMNFFIGKKHKKIDNEEVLLLKMAKLDEEAEKRAEK